ncbi:MAG: type II toxin-antitoxin system RelE family toxin [Phycisphaerae bacterium]
MAEVEISPAAEREIARLPLVIRARVWDIVTALEQWPNVSGAKPLRGTLAGHYRKRTGDYRVQFRASGNRIVIERVGHRDGFYED